MQVENNKSSDSTFTGTVNFLWVILLIGSLLCGGLVFYDYVNEIIDLNTMMVGPIFVVLSIFTILIPPYYKVIYANRFLSNLIRWFVGLACVLSLIFIYNFTRNISPVVYSVKFLWEEEIDIEFRENNTFRTCNSDMFSSSVSYGKYQRNNDKIILVDEIKFGMSKMNDTLIINEKGIDFTLAEPWRVSSGTLHYVK